MCSCEATSYKLSSILSSEVEGQNHFQKPQDGSSEAASIYIKEKKIENNPKFGF